VAHAAADGAGRADQAVSDTVGRDSKHRQSLREQRAVLDLCVGGEGTNCDGVATVLDVAEVGAKSAQVDEHRGPGDAQLHRGQ
jgi:hypothetical protein